MIYDALRATRVDRRSQPVLCIRPATGGVGSFLLVVVGIDVAQMAKVGPLFLLCLPTQLLTPILCATTYRQITSSPASDRSPAVTEPQLMAEIRTRKMASPNNLRRPCKTSLCMQRCIFPFRAGAIVSSPIFVEKLASFGSILYIISSL